MVASLEVIKIGKHFGTGINRQQLCNTQQLHQDNLRRCVTYRIATLNVNLQLFVTTLMSTERLDNWRGVKACIQSDEASQEGWKLPWVGHFVNFVSTRPCC